MILFWLEQIIQIPLAKSFAALFVSLFLSNTVQAGTRRGAAARPFERYLAVSWRAVSRMTSCLPWSWCRCFRPPKACGPRQISQPVANQHTTECATRWTDARRGGARTMEHRLSIHAAPRHVTPRAGLRQFQAGASKSTTTQRHYGRVSVRGATASTPPAAPPRPAHPGPPFTVGPYSPPREDICAWGLARLARLALAVLAVLGGPRRRPRRVAGGPVPRPASPWS